MDKLSSDHEELKREMFRLQEGRRETAEKIKELALHRDDTLKTLEKFSRDKDDIKREIADLKEKKQNLNGSLEKLRIDLVNLFKNFSEKEVRLNFLKELEKSFEGYFPGVKAIMTARKKNRELSGITGVVGSLIQVPQIYEKAIEINSEHRSAYRNIGNAYYSIHNNEKYLENFKKAARLGDIEIQNWLRANGHSW
jgi:chromosome segregation protein